jgi:hypothetical protein
MSGFLEHYGEGDEKREHRRRNIILSVVGLIVVSVTLYFTFRNYREEKQLTLFFDLLKQQSYKTAYEMWGCTDKTPCRDYSYEKFQEDWGPKSQHANLSEMKVVKTDSCSGGVLQVVKFGAGEDLNLWVDRKDRLVGFAPWPLYLRGCPGFLERTKRLWNSSEQPAEKK